MCVMDKQFVFYSVYVDLHYDEISLTSSAGSESLCCVCSCVVVFGFVMVLYVDAVVAVTVMCVLLFVCMLRDCEGAMVTAMLVWGMDEVW